MKSEEVEVGIRVKTPDGRIGTVLNYRFYAEGDKAPGRVAVQLKKDSGYVLEGFSLLELERVWEAT